MIDRTERKRNGQLYFYGAVCPKHPELEGRRQPYTGHQCVGCRKEGTRRWWRSGSIQCGPCLNPTCGKMFESRVKGKQYCSLECYRNHPYAQEQLRLSLERTALGAVHGPQGKIETGIIVSPRGRKMVRKFCLNECGQLVERTKRVFCSNRCYREFMAKRFDRWIASPGSFEELQNFDEFLTQEELPCLIEGCGWVGQGLCWHTNYVHGVPAAELKELAGFNARSSVMGHQLQEQYKRAFAHWTKQGELNPMNQPRFVAARTKSLARQIKSGKRAGGIRREGLEHMAKARALALAMPGPKRRCLHCHCTFTQRTPYGVAEFCSKRCVTDYQSLVTRARRRGHMPKAKVRRRAKS